MQLLHQKVSRDCTAAEEHCDGDENGDSFSQGEILDGQRVGRQSREDDYQSRMGKGVNHSVNVGTDDHMVLQHFLVAFQRKAVGPEEKAALLDLRSQGKGYADHMDNGSQHDRHDDQHDKDVHHIEDPVA